MQDPKKVLAPQKTANAAPMQLQTIPFQSLQMGKLLGHGGYGDVYAAQWHGTEVAIKQLHLKTLSHTLQEEFLQEAQIMSQCLFPNIVGLYGICDEPGHNGLVMEYMPKGSLKSLLENKSEEISWNLRWEIAIDIGKGISYLHGKNILHRDLKSLNVLLGNDYHAKICDFGLSKIKLESSSSSTKSKTGTVRWRAPESFKRGFKPAESMDIYSYGMVLWEIASREIPFADAPDEITAMGFIKDGEKETLPPDCPKPYGTEIQKCWEEAEKRPSALEVVTHLTKAKPAPIPVIAPVLSPISKKPTKKGYVEKSWHFDPATERSAALSATPDAKYQLLEATEKDKQKAVESYQHHPVPGYEIGRVQIIYNRTFNVKFNLHLETLQEKKGNPAFASKWPSMPNPAQRQKTHSLLEQISGPYTDPDYPDVKIIPAWHGTKPEILDSIFRIGYSNLAFTDAGFFGKGLYSAYEAEYSHRAYSKGALILNWVACFSALPVIDGDMSMLTGHGNYGNYDAHFVPVAPLNPNDPNEVNYFPCKAQQTHTYTEIVVFETAACLPRYLVELQTTLPKAPKPTPVLVTPVIQAIALYDFTARDAIELSFNAGQTIQILNQTGEWWIGEINQRRGKIPSNYVTLKQKETPAIKILLPQSVTPVSFGSPQTFFPQQKPIKILPAGYEYKQTLTGHSVYVRCVAGLPNGNIISGSHDKTLKEWDTTTGQCLKTLTGHSSDIWCVAVLPNGNIISGSDDKMLKEWDKTTGQCLKTLTGHSNIVTCVAVLPNGNIISGSYDKTLKEWDKTTGQCLKTLMGHSGYVLCVAMLPNGNIISGSTDKTLKEWDKTTGQCLKTLAGHSSYVSCVAVLLNGNIISGSDDYTLMEWEDKNRLALKKEQEYKAPTPQ